MGKQEENLYFEQLFQIVCTQCKQRKRSLISDAKDWIFSKYRTDAFRKKTMKSSAFISDKKERERERKRY